MGSIPARERPGHCLDCTGKAVGDIADIITCSLETVRTYKKSAMRKLSVVKSAQMDEAALRMGVIDFLVSIAPYEP